MIEQGKGYANADDFAQEVINTLIEQEIDLTLSHPFAFYLYLPSEKAAKQAKTSLVAQGLDVEIEAPQITDDWLCFCTINMVAEAEKLAVLGEVFLQLAQQLDGEFDGWELENDDDSLEIDLSAFMQPDYKKIAKDVLAQIKAGFQPSYEFAKVDPQDFAEFDLSIYDDFQSLLEAKGFQFLANLENTTISATGFVTMIRVMVHPTDKLIACCYFVPALGYAIHEFESCFTEGGMVLTTTAPSNNKIVNTPNIIENHVHGISTLDELLAAHNDLISNLNEPSMQTLAEVTDFDAMVKFQNHMAKTKYEHLKSIGWVTEEYLVGLSGGDTKMAKNVYQAILEL